LQVIVISPSVDADRMSANQSATTVDLTMAVDASSKTVEPGLRGRS